MYLPTDFGLSFVNRHSSFPEIRRTLCFSRSRTRCVGSGHNFSGLFGLSGTPVLVPGFQWSGWSNSGVHGQIRVHDAQIRTSQGLSTAVLHSGWKSPPHPQNTSAVVGSLKYRFVLVSSWVISGKTSAPPKALGAWARDLMRQVTCRGKTGGKWFKCS